MPRERIEVAKVDYMAKWRDRYEELAKNIKIDKNSLDDELVHQPELYHEAGRLYSSAVSSRDEAKNERDSLRGKIDLRIRDQLERNTEKKPPETQIANMVVADPDYLDAQERYQEWDRLAGQGAALREDFHARGFGLRELANLWIAGYYQNNSVTRRDAVDRRSEEYHRAREAEAVGVDRHRRRPDRD
jgi:hypothetical protein